MDLISELPDDILLYVLSSLTLKEVGMTSVVSKRWKHMWKYHPILNFGYLKEVYLPPLIYKPFIEVEKHMYLNMVDKVVKSHKAPSIDEFRVHVGIDLPEEGSSTNKKSIDNWFRFAMEKRVKRLEIDLIPLYGGSNTRRHMIPSLSLCNTLTSLKLGYINIDGEILQSFLRNCQALEYLSVKNSESLVHLKVSGPSLNLKHLEIYSCYNLRRLVISAPKLESFCYFGLDKKVQFKSTPKLVQVSVGCAYGLTNICSDLSGYLSQIEIFKIDCHGILEESLLFARLEKLEKLVMTFFPGDDDDLYYFTSVIKACPLLQHFKLKLNTFVLRNAAAKELSDCETREQLKWEACPHYHLETLEILGFIGYPIDLEFTAYLVENAPSLNKIVADTRDVLLEMRFPKRYSKDTQRRRRARERAELIRANLRPNTILEIV